MRISQSKRITSVKELTKMMHSFEIIRTKVLERLSGFGIAAEEETQKIISCRFESESDAVVLSYDKQKKLYELFRGAKEDKNEQLTKLQSYLFDEEAGDGTKEANSVANEFIDSLVAKPVKSAVAQRRRADKASDESSAIFFVNRIPSVMPECREPLLLHKSHYEQVLPRYFCEEVVNVAFADARRKGEKGKLSQFCNLLSNMYKSGDLDTKSIIVQVILASVPQSEVEYINSLLSDDLSKAWKHGRKWYNRKVKAPKKTAMEKFTDAQARTLRDMER